MDAALPSHLKHDERARSDVQILLPMLECGDGLGNEFGFAEHGRKFQAQSGVQPHAFECLAKFGGICLLSIAQRGWRRPQNVPK